MLFITLNIIIILNIINITLHYYILSIFLIFKLFIMLF